jgi:putative acetyltransferase
MMRIRRATSLDREDVSEVHLSAFPEGERELISRLAINLLSERTIPETISLLAETEGAVAGHVAFSPVTIDGNDNLQGYILAPLGVKPDYQKRRIGSKLVEDGMQQLLKMDVNLLFVYGDPQYYRKFGFSRGVADRYIPPYKLQYPFGWQAVILNECNVEKSSIKIACVKSLSDPKLW